MKWLLRVIIIFVTTCRPACYDTALLTPTAKSDACRNNSRKPRKNSRCMSRHSPLFFLFFYNCVAFLLGIFILSPRGRNDYSSVFGAKHTSLEIGGFLFYAVNQCPRPARPVGESQAGCLPFACTWSLRENRFSPGWRNSRVI